MASTIEKVKQALHLDKNSSTSTTHSTSTHGNNVPEGTAGPHNSRVANAADPRIDSDMDGSNRHTGTTGTTHSTGTHTGAGIGHSTHTTGTGVGHNNNTTAGPHSSNLLNKADPTVDSDLSGGNHMGAQSDTRTAGYSGTGAGYGTTGTHGTHNGAHTGTTGTGPFGSSGHSTNAGPHNSNLLNKADPRVDSDLSGSHHNTAGSGLTGTTGHSTTGAGYGSTHTGTGTSHSNTTTAGPHSSNLLNKADPRVDSDRSNTHGATIGTGYGSTGTHAGTGTHGGISHSTNAGPHNSNALNKADPRVDSDLDGRGGHVGHTVGGITGASGSHATPGSGTAQNTAGPHNSDILNKLDPRVDSDLSGGKTFGGNKTHQ